MSGSKMFGKHGGSVVTVAAACVVAGLTGFAQAAPYASNVVNNGTSVDFILNENADSLTYVVNGGGPQAITPTKGSHTFAIPAGATFSITAAKNAATGYNISTGGTIAT